MIDQNLKSQACALRHLVCMGLIDAPYIVTWADKLILSLDTAPAWLTDLALCNSSSEAITLLALVPGESSPELYWPCLKQQLASKLEAGSVPLQAIASYCYNLALSGEIPAYDCEALYQFELEYDSIFTGYGTQAEVDVQLIRFFNKALSK